MGETLRSVLRLLMISLLAMIFLNAVASSSKNSLPPLESVIEMEERRGVEQTFLTFPEWYLVHSPAEFAREIATKPTHEFPFVAHIGQLWSSYGSVVREQVRETYPINAGYHVMIAVIGSSTTLEYSMRWIYENTLGRISWALSSEQHTAEEQFAAVVAQDYVNFIRQQPWYLFDFTEKLKSLWTTVPAYDTNLLRKWERRYALTTEYLVKAIYGKIIEKATRTAYTPAVATTRVQVDHFTSEVQIENVKLVRQLADGTAVIDMPRYFDFRLAATALATKNIHLLDIAGNQSVILVSAWVNTDFADRRWRVLFKQDLITQPGKKRVALVVPVRELSNFLNLAPSNGISVEHIYDY